MSNLSLDFDNFGSIRRTDDGYYSVHDLIRVVTNGKEDRKIWNRLTEQYPETVAKCHSLKPL